MPIFILIFLSVYAGLHAVILWGIMPLIKGRPVFITLCCLWMVIMILSPMAARMLEYGGNHTVAYALALISFSWMGFAFLAFCVFSLLGVWEMAGWVINKASAAMPPLSLRSRMCSTAVLLITAGAAAYGVYEASNIRIERVSIKTSKLAPGSAPITIAQVSDMHLGLLRGKGELADVVAKLQQLNPDMIVATGDTIDAIPDHFGSIYHLWLKLDPPLGKFAVLGNHEYYAGLEESILFHENSGFTMLRGRGLAVNERLNIAGVDDPAGGFPSDEVRTLRLLDSSRYTVLLKHRPTINEAAAAMFDLQLSGHSHRGQIFPFNFLTAMQYPLQDGLYTLASGSQLYTSRGTGTWGPPMRIASPPEITIFEIAPKH